MAARRRPAGKLQIAGRATLWKRFLPGLREFDAARRADARLRGRAGGSLDGDPGIRPAYHIFAGSKAPWHEITDSLPQHQEYPPSS